ncbi:MAG: hypothetical protein ACFFD1_15565, partial [Candidatus Thorarchaeota archaeon]
IIFILFMIFGIESMPETGIINTSPSWSHSLIMALIWSFFASLVIWYSYGNVYTNKNLINEKDIPRWRNRKFQITTFIGLLSFSHWLLDFIASPMTAVFPTDTGKQILPIAESITIGLGLMSTNIGVLLIEGGSIFIGLIIYFSFKINFQTEKVASKI